MKDDTKRKHFNYDENNFLILTHVMTITYTSVLGLIRVQSSNSKFMLCCGKNYNLTKYYK